VKQWNKPRKSYILFGWAKMLRYKTAVRFLTRKFRKVLYLHWETHCSLLAFTALAVVWGGLQWDGSWKTSAACYHRRWRQSHAHCRCWRRGHAPPARKPNPNLNQRPPLALFCLKLDTHHLYDLSYLFPGPKTICPVNFTKIQTNKCNWSQKNS